MVLFCKKSLDDLKKGDYNKNDHSKDKSANFSMRMRLKHGVEIIIVQGKRLLNLCKFFGDKFLLNWFFEIEILCYTILN